MSGRCLMGGGGCVAQDYVMRQSLDSDEDEPPAADLPELTKEQKQVGKTGGKTGKKRGENGTNRGEIVAGSAGDAQAV